MDTPGFTKPTHVYGTEFGDWDLNAPVADGVPQLSADDDWAGKGFAHPEPVQEEIAGEVPDQATGLGLA